MATQKLELRNKYMIYIIIKFWYKNIYKSMSDLNSKNYFSVIHNSTFNIVCFKKSFEPIS